MQFGNTKGGHRLLIKL